MSSTGQSTITRHPVADGSGLRIDSLGCGLDAVYLNAAHRACVMVLPGGDHPHMQEAVALVRILLPQVKLIGLVNEYGWDGVFELGDDGHWRGTMMCDAPLGSVLSVSMEPQYLLDEVALLSQLVDSGQYVNHAIPIRGQSESSARASLVMH